MNMITQILTMNYLRFKRQIKNDTMVNAKEGKKKSA